MRKLTCWGCICLFCLLRINLSSAQDAQYLVGIGKADITYMADSIGLFGYGNYHQRTNKDDVFTSKIYSRVICIKEPDSGEQIIYVHADLGAIFHTLHSGLLSKIQKNLLPDFKESNLIISASHTHCAPSGMSHHGLYMGSAPGFNPDLVAFTIEQMYASVVQAINSQEQCRLRVKEGHFPPQIPVAFNRSLKAHNKNKDLDRKYDRTETNLAINRNMPLLNFERLDGTTLGFINWFGVHPIEVLDDHKFIDGASKGYAAQYAEEDLYGNVVAIFAQSGAGDVMTSDFHNPDAFDELMRKETGDSTCNHAFTNLSHAKWNGRKQAEKAIEISNSTSEFTVDGPIDCELIYVDMSDVLVDKDFSNGEKKAFTSSPCLGTPFFSGSFYWKDKNPRRRGLNFVAFFNRFIFGNRFFFLKRSKRKYRMHLYRSQFPKLIVVDGSEKSIFGAETKNFHRKGFSRFFLKTIANLDINIEELVRQIDIGALKENTLLPQILPVQILRIGNIAIIGLPTEITTVAHNRLQNTIAESLKDTGIQEVFISSYANEYAGYTTTYEEYKTQRYEGGHTLYGRHQLGGFQTVFKKFATEFVKPKEERNLDRTLRPDKFSDEELEKRSNLKPLKEKE